MADFTPTQGRYLAFIHAYTNVHGYPPAESEIATAMCVSPPSVNQMVKMLERKGLILRQPGQARTIQLLVPEDEIPPWHTRRPGQSAARTGTAKGWTPSRAAAQRAAPANLFVLSVFLSSGPISEHFPSKVINRVIEIRGDQTLHELHYAIFDAYDRWEQHAYEFQFGKRPFDPKGPNYGIGDGPREHGDARTTKVDALGLKVGRVFGYWFDFGDDWFHQIEVVRIDRPIPTVTYPRVIKRVGESPPQYLEE
jgi:hypothetical protein